MRARKVNKVSDSEFCHQSVMYAGSRRSSFNRYGIRPSSSYLIMGCGAEMVKFVLLAFNTLCMACGIFIFSFLIPIIKQGSYLSDMEVHKAIKIASIGALVLASIIFFVPFLGCCGALRGKSGTLRFYSVIMFFLFLSQVVVTIFIWTNYNKFHEYLDKSLDKIWQARHEHHQILDGIQKTFECCGIKSYRDWGTDFPLSCCKPGNNECHSYETFQRGCKEVLGHLWDSKAPIIKYGEIAASGVILLASTFASYLAHKIRREAEGEDDYY